MNKRFNGKVVLVTGAASGIGKANALLFSKEGAKVIVADKESDKGYETVQTIRSSGRESMFFEVDVSKAKEVKGLISEIVTVYGRLDCAHNNAGIAGIASSTHNCTEENWDRTINVNLKGVWLCMKYEISQMLKQSYGSIVNTSSVAGLVGLKGWPAYVASKHGVIGLTKAASLEYAKRGIRINAVCPNIVQTPMAKVFTRNDSQIELEMIRMTPIGRMAKPEEVAEAVAWLSSDDASYVTGHAMIVDGGMTAQ